MAILLSGGLPMLATGGTPATALGSVVGVSVTFGEYTNSGEGAFDVGNATAISSGDASSHWQISAGNLTLTSAGQTALRGNGADSYTLVLDNGTTLNVTIEANAAHVATLAELDAYRDGTNTFWPPSTTAINTIYLRGPSKGGPAKYEFGAAYDPNNNANITPTTFASADNTDRAVVDQWYTHTDEFALGGTVHTDTAGWSLTLRNIDFDWTEPTSLAQFDDLAGGKKILFFNAAQNVLVDNCTVNGNLGRADEGGYAFSTLTGISFPSTGSNMKALDCTVHNVESCFNPACDGAVIEGCTGYYFHGDYVSTNGNWSNGSLKNCHCYGVTGNPSYRHPDWCQVNLGGGTPDTIEIVGNTSTMGGVTRIYDKTESPVETEAPVVVTASGAYNLTDANKYRNLVMRPASGQTITVTAPACASNDCKGWFVQADLSNGGTVAISLNGADTHVNGASNMADNEFKAFISTGGSEWQDYEVSARWWNYTVRETKTLTAGISDATVRISTHDTIGGTSADKTITLPAGATGLDFSVQRIYPNTNTVTIQRAGSDTMNIDGVTGQTSFTLAEGEGYRITWSGADWTVTRQAPSFQGLFGNNGITNLTMHGNILVSHAANTLWLEGDMTGSVVNNNQFLPFAISGHPLSPARVKARYNDDTDGDNNLISDSLTQDPGTTSTNDIVCDFDPDLGESETLVTTYLNGSTLADIAAETTRAGLVDACRMGSSYLTQGATGTTDANGYYNFSTGAVN